MNTLYRTRTFSEKFSLVFEWMRNEWKPILKYVTLFLLPVSLLQGFGISGVAQLSMADLYTQTNGAYDFSNADAFSIVGMVLYYISSIVGAFVIYGLSLFFVRRNLMDGLTNDSLTAGEVWNGIWSYAPRLILSGIALTVILVVCVVVIAVLGAALPLTFILTIPAFIALCVALLPLLPVYTLTDEGLFSSLKHSVRLGFKCWGGFLGTFLVMGLLTLVIGGFASLPFYIFIMIKAIVGSNLSGVSAGVVDFFMYLGGVLSLYSYYALNILTVAIVCVQYGHAADKCDGVTAQREVDEFPEF